MQLLRGGGRPLAIGHRGAAALAPENTRASLEAAVAHRVDAIEFDVLAHDGRLVLAHSAHEVPADVLTLDEALAWFAPRAESLHVDVKATVAEAEIVDALRRHGVAERAFVSSTEPDVLRRFAALAPELPRALTYPADRHDLSARVGPLVGPGLRVAAAALPHRIVGILGRAQATVASLEERVVTAAVVRRCHAAGIPVVAWTVNDPQRIRALAALGVDGVVSDDPRMLAATLLAS